MRILNVADVQKPLSTLATANLEKLEVFSSIASTNTYLMTQPAPAAGRFRIAIADHQTSGRGRHHRRWISAPGAGLCMSMSYTFARMPDHLPALTLAIGVAVIASLRLAGVEGVSLKWPNDVVARDGKLGGILTEVQSHSGDGVTVVVGLGLNVHMRDQIDFGEDSDWAHRAVDLNSLMDELPEREFLAATVIEHLYGSMARFAAQGFDSGEWQQHDWLLDREVTVDMAEKQITGTASGVDEDGALLINTKTGRQRVISGSIVMAGGKGQRG
jgi:BirA family biotin operon repressor/biotin-[acetyl-CoA-carboxylase] ligase